ncbi:ABC transporter ATP-binding protein/permease [Breznakia pachnodae]|uniref:ATP-binding cassette subfamily C protein n=1 Tax=Breznakia pachnodae TaxID=265178 RepID=A0ABU0E6B7_9FIRM|nr:ABC transporter ATP-binding protein/permease [Breznakia pachnodae]MDQ0362243.1 ATP-binding cassette subfamily C protein [Breznakia pachnodae]
MINKRLLQSAADSKKYIYYQVLCQWISLLAQIVLIGVIANIFNDLYADVLKEDTIIISFAIVAGCLVIRFVMDKLMTRMSYLASKDIKLNLRKQIFEKLFLLNRTNQKELKNAELVQLTVEGVDQLETYFGRYMPQFFYSLLAPLTLFIVLSTISFKAAIVLFICVPIIPMSIVMVQKFAKKLLSKYWGMYANLGDRFLDNIRGLTTLKIYESDKEQQEKMNEEAENFRKVTMKVLVMQLNSISIMDLVAFGGAAVGIVFSLIAFNNNEITIGETFMMIMLSAEFFIPLRLLGSFFHIAMNGNAASKKIFSFLDAPISDKRTNNVDDKIKTVEVKELVYSYDDKKDVLKGINVEFKDNGLYAFVGESGCGKSTLSTLLTGGYDEYKGNILLNGKEVNTIDFTSLHEQITKIEDYNYLFKGTVYSALLDGNPKASEDEMWQALDIVNLSEYLKTQDGLHTKLMEKGSNLSGGQAQRLALARALLHDSSVYIFDEATSNIDVESELDIVNVIHKLAKEKIVIFISHRLANVHDADIIYVMKDGAIVEQGTHQQLYSQSGLYKEMNDVQMSFEAYTGGETHA